jgi:hypothetical protein
LYSHIRDSLIELYHNKGIALYEKLQRQHPFQNDVEFTKLVFDFKQTYRFGINFNEETLLSSLIEKAFSRVKNGDKSITDKFQYYQLLPPDKNKFNSLASFLTDVKRVEQAIWTILNICLKHSNGIGKLKFELQEFQNKLLLNIVDIGSKCNKNVENLKGGDFETIIQKLWAVCDFNILATFKDGKNYKTKILPEVNTIEPIEMSLEGFTYQIVFYTSLPKVLLIDDKFKERGYNIANDDNLIQWTYLQDINVLPRYNAILLHNSYNLIQATEIIRIATEFNIPLIRFSGGSTSTKAGNDIFLEAKTMYENLPYFLENIRKNYIINTEILLYGKGVMYKKKYQEKSNLIDIIKQTKPDYSNLDSHIKVKIANLLGISQEKIPQFKDLSTLNQFLEKQLKQFKQ